MKHKIESWEELSKPYTPYRYNKTVNIKIPEFCVSCNTSLELDDITDKLCGFCYSKV